MGLLQLAFDQLRIHAVRVSHELSVCAPLDDTVLVNHADQVGVLHRAQSVCNDEDGSPLHCIFNRSLHQVLGLGVKG